MENLYLKHGLVSRTYSKKSLIMASIVGFKSKFFMIMSPFISSAKLTAPPVANSAIRMLTNLRKSLRTSPSMTLRAGMTRKNSLSRSRLFLRLKASKKTLTEDFLSSKTRLTSYKMDRDQPLGAQHTSLMLMPMQSIPTLACNEPPKLNSFAFRERTGPSPQPQALGTTFEARVRDYMAAYTERMERFENAIFKQREEINDRMTEMFGLLKELTTSKTPEKVLIRNEAKVPVTKNVNSISLARGEEEGSDKTDETLNNTVKPTVTKTEIPVKEAKRSNETKIKPVKRAEKKEVEELLSSRPVEYYLKHRINEKLIEGLVDNNRFNDSLSRARVGKVKGKTYNVLPRGPVYEAILKKKITKKEDIRGNFKIPCSIGGLKNMNALVDQGSDVNVMPFSTYMKLTDEMPAKTDIRLSLATHSYIYPLGIVEDILVEIAEHVYPVDFVILDSKENEKMPFILGTPFLTTTKVKIKFDKGTITLRSGKSKEEKIKLHLEREMKFNKWRSKSYKGKHPTLITTKEEMDDEGEVT
ncbi:MAK10-like protein [Tanacetum coccineum]